MSNDTWPVLAWLRLLILHHIWKVVSLGCTANMSPKSLPYSPPACTAALAPVGSRDATACQLQSFYMGCFTRKLTEVSWVGRVLYFGQPCQPKVFQAVTRLDITSLLALQLRTICASEFTLSNYCSCPVAHSPTAGFGASPPCTPFADFAIDCCKKGRSWNQAAKKRKSAARPLTTSMFVAWPRLNQWRTIRPSSENFPDVMLDDIWRAHGAARPRSSVNQPRFRMNNEYIA
jgi:hypothetical protein